MALDDSLKGFAVTFRQMLRKPETIGYPERKTPVFPRFRGRHRLWRHDNGLEKCVGCSLCVAACPQALAADCSRWAGDRRWTSKQESAGCTRIMGIVTAPGEIPRGFPRTSQPATLISPSRCRRNNSMSASTMSFVSSTNFVFGSQPN